MGLRSVMITLVLMALVFAVAGHKNQGLQAPHNFGKRHSCTDDPSMYGYLPPCSTTTTSPTTTSSTITTTDSTTQAPTPLERANWCRLANGTYLPLHYTYLNAACSLCECLPSRFVRCRLLQCMPTYCVDNTMPTRHPGQCCTQCAYERSVDACTYKNATYPHGTIIEAIEDKMQCWCQLGNIECRNYMGSLFQGLDTSTTVYIIVIVLIVVLLFGLLLCVSCTFGCYYYFRRNQNTFQQAYDEYINSAGWQPMDENEENVVDPNAEEKYLEAEKSQFENPVVEVVPPPYSAYNGSYVSEEK